jgi:hypothetical protein
MIGSDVGGFRLEAELRNSTSTAWAEMGLIRQVVPQTGPARGRLHHDSALWLLPH